MNGAPSGVNLQDENQIQWSLKGEPSKFTRCEPQPGPEIAPAVAPKHGFPTKAPTKEQVHPECTTEYISVLSSRVPDPPRDGRKPRSTSSALQELKIKGRGGPKPPRPPVTTTLLPQCGLVGHWTNEDTAILLQLAHRIRDATTQARGFRATGGSPAWPQEAYRPAQAWTATLNL
jgi:hypothetical protein